MASQTTRQERTGEDTTSFLQFPQAKRAGRARAGRALAISKLASRVGFTRSLARGALRDCTYSGKKRGCRGIQVKQGGKTR